MGRVDEIANFVVCLLSDRSGIVTGSVINWDQPFSGCARLGGVRQIGWNVAHGRTSVSGHFVHQPILSLRVVRVRPRRSGPKRSHEQRSDPRGHQQSRHWHCPRLLGHLVRRRPQPVPADRFLDEVVRAGYEWIEIGAYGYLSTDPAKLRDDLSSRRLKVSGGTAFARLQHPGTIDEVWDHVAPIASLTAAMGAQHVVVIPDLWRDDLTGNEKESRELSAEQWTALVDGHNELGRRMLEEYGVHSQFHSHADSHVGYQRDVERFLESTDPQFVNLCLDTGHIAYYGGDSVELITKYPDRVGYLHLKQVDPALAARALAEDISFSKAVRMDIMVEPPSGVPDLAEVISAATELLPHSVFAIVEQDMYPCPPDKPFPIARRTYTYLTSCL